MEILLVFGLYFGAGLIYGLNGIVELSIAGELKDKSTKQELWILTILTVEWPHCLYVDLKADLTSNENTSSK